MTLYEIIKSLQEAQGSLSKQAILDQHKDNELLKAYMKAVYDPGINYYQTKLNHADLKTWPGDQEFDGSDIIFMTQVIATRVITGLEAEVNLNGHVSALNQEGRELIQLMLDRKIGANVGDTMVLKTWPDLYFTVPYMRCSLMDAKVKEKFNQAEWFYVQTKMDGAFGYVVTTEPACNAGFEHHEIYTRQGGRYPQWFASLIGNGNAPNAVIVGELLVYEDGKLLDRKTGNGILNSILQGADEFEFRGKYTFRHVAWDELTLAEFKVGKSERPYWKRFEALKACRDTLDVVISTRCYSLEEAYQVYSSCLERGEEGVICKLPDSTWKDGTSKDNVKLKIKFEAEFRCTGMYEGTGKAKGMMGGANYETEDGLMKFNCGTGYTDKQRKDAWNNPETFVGKVHTLSANDIIQSRDTRKEPALSLPAFEEVRLDKTVANILEEVRAALEAAKKA